MLPILDEIIATRPASEWLERMNAAEIPCGPIYAIEEALNDPHVQARRFIVQLEHPTAGLIRSLAFPATFSDTPLTYRRPPPRLGEHTEEVLGELGYGPNDIQRLHTEGIF